jgi:trehalose/maltose transport system permease protein
MKRNLRDSAARYGFLVPAVALVVLIALGPMLFTVWLSLRRQMPVFGISGFVGLANFQRILQDAHFWTATFTTSVFVIESVFLELVLGLAFALLLHREFRGRALARALVLIPWAVPGVVVARFWEWILNADYGVLNYLLGVHINWLGNPFWALQAVVVADVWKSTPFVVLLLLAGLQVVPPELYRAARIDGASGWQQFRHVTLPLLKPVILLVLLFRTMDAARIFDVIFVLTGGGPANQTETLVIYAYKTLYRMLQFGFGSALSVATFLFVLALSLVYLRMLRRTWRLREG